MVIGRPGGLTLSGAAMTPERAVAATKTLLDVNTWREDRSSYFIQRRDALWTAVAHAAPDNRVAARLDLARFYIATGFYLEAKAAIDAFQQDQPAGSEDSNLLIAHAVASILAGSPEQGRKDLENPRSARRRFGAVESHRASASRQRRRRVTCSRASITQSARCRSSCSASPSSMHFVPRSSARLCGCPSRFNELLNSSASRRSKQGDLAPPRGGHGRCVGP